MSAHQGPVAVPFDLEVTEHLEMEVPAGKFQCAKVETNLKQTFYISMDADRRLVQFEAGPAKIKLIKSEPWSVDQPRGFKSEHLGASFSVPGFMLNSPETSEEEVYRLQVWSIVRRLVESMDGRISVESEKGRGSSFTVVLKKGGER